MGFEIPIRLTIHFGKLSPVNLGIKKKKKGKKEKKGKKKKGGKKHACKTILSEKIRGTLIIYSLLCGKLSLLCYNVTVLKPRSTSEKIKKKKKKKGNFNTEIRITFNRVHESIVHAFRIIRIFCGITWFVINYLWFRRSSNVCCACRDYFTFIIFVQYSLLWYLLHFAIFIGFWHKQSSQTHSSLESSILAFF